MTMSCVVPEDTLTVWCWWVFVIWLSVKIKHFNHSHLFGPRLSDYLVIYLCTTTCIVYLWTPENYLWMKLVRNVHGSWLSGRESVCLRSSNWQIYWYPQSVWSIGHNKKCWECWVDWNNFKMKLKLFCFGVIWYFWWNFVCIFITVHLH